MATAALDLESQLIEEVAACADDPLAYAQRFYPWGEKELALSNGPRKWQAKILSTIRDHLQDPETRFQPLRIAVASGKGIGDPLRFMIIDWGMSTCGDCKV